MILSWVKVAEWPPFAKELQIQLTVRFLCAMSICNFSYFPLWFRGQDIGYNCIDFWSLLTCFTFHEIQIMVIDIQLP